MAPLRRKFTVWLEFNDTLCEMMGYTREELNQKTCVDLTFFNDLPASIDQFHSLLSGKIRGYAVDKRFVRKDGSLIYTHVIVQSVFNDEGLLDYLVTQVEDQSHRKQAESALRHYEAQLLLMSKQAKSSLAALDSIENPMLTVSRNGLVQFANISAKEWLAESSLIVIKDGMLHLQNGDQRSTLAHAIAQAIENNSVTELVLSTKVQNKFWVTVLPLRNKSWFKDECENQSEALVVLHKTNVDVSQTSEFLRHGYKLSESEIKLAEALSNGITPENFAIAANIQISTVRTQLRSIFYKTGSKRQSDVVRLLAGAPRIRKDISNNEPDATNHTLELKEVQSLNYRLHQLDVMDRITQISLTAESIEGVMNGVLDMILEIFGADRAWFRYPCDPYAPTWSVPIERTLHEWPGIKVRGVHIPLTPEMAEQFKMQLDCKNTIQYAQGGDVEVPRSLAEEFSVKSQLQIAIQPKNRTPWLFGIHHCARTVLHDSNEKNLFKAIALRISEILNNWMTSKQLQESESKLKELMQNSHQQD
jgi:PAS domain S-box-containing protein